MKIPVILDTDIGGDIDDAWALAFLLNSPELDLKMVLVGTGDVEYRARNAAKMLDIAGRSNVPIGLGIGNDIICNSVETWLEDYPLSKYPGKVFSNGVDEACRIIRESESFVTIIAIGPLCNLAAMLDKWPGIVNKSRIAAMTGSISKGLDGQEGRIAEWNVAQDVPAAKKVYSSDWDITITPLDTCGVVRLDGELYAKIKASKKPLTASVIEQFRVWDKKHQNGLFEKRTSILFDTVAVYLAYSQEKLVMKNIFLRIEDDGMMTEDKRGKEIHCAVEWKDLEGFKKHLVERLQ